MATLDLLPDLERMIMLTCSRCGHPGVYDVKVIAVPPKSFPARKDFSDVQFTGYFHCPCGSPGPWEPVDKEAFAILVKQAGKQKGIYSAVMRTYDKKEFQTSAMAAAHLKAKFERAPQDAYLCSRLGNLLRACGQHEASITWYRKALELDPADLESRCHLFIYAENDGDDLECRRHGTLLVTHMLAGARAREPELSRYIAQKIVDSVVFEKHVWRSGRRTSKGVEGSPTDRFIHHTLLLDEDADKAMARAVDVLLGAAELQDTLIEPGDMEPHDVEPADGIAQCWHPTLRAAAEAQPLDLRATLRFGCEAEGKRILINGRQNIACTDGARQAIWVAPPIQSLFRGNQPAPKDIARYPKAYVPHFAILEQSFLVLCNIRGDLTDQEMEEIYTALLRRPDGRSLGVNHDFMWQACAFWLGTHEISQSEYEGVLDTLVASTRRWALKPVSRFYVQFLRDMFGSQ